MRGEDVEYARRLLSRDGYLEPTLARSTDRYDEDAAAASRAAKWALGFPDRYMTDSFGTRLERFLTGSRKPPLRWRIRAKARADRVSVGLLAVREAVRWIGTTETPPNSNIAKPFTEWYGWKGWGAPWCAVFVSYCLAKAGFKTVDPKAARWAYCPYFLRDAREGRYGLKIVSDKPRAGDIVLFDWDDDGVADHIGFVLDWVGGGKFVTVEGNTSATDNSNGGEVQKRTRTTADAIAFVRVS